MAKKMKKGVYREKKMSVTKKRKIKGDMRSRWAEYMLPTKG